jgi:hypothetical protein
MTFKCRFITTETPDLSCKSKDLSSTTPQYAKFG